MFDDNDHLYPSKPELVQPEQGARYGRLIISMVLFFAVFLLLVSNNFVLGTEIIVILLVHEFGHLLMMKLFGYKSLNMIFIPLLGALVTGNKVRVSQKQKFLISLMGPLPGIILGCVVFLFALGQNPNNYLVEFALLLLSINLFNMIPLDPLDGGNMIETLFFPTNDQFKMYFTFISSLLIIGIGVYTGFFPVSIFGFLMAFKVRAYQKNKIIHDDLDSIDFNYKREYSELSDREYWTMRRVFLENNPRIKELIPDDNVVWENERLIVEQMNQLLRFEVKKDLSPLQRFLWFILFVAAIAVPIWLVSINYHLVEWYIQNAGF